MTTTRTPDKTYLKDNLSELAYELLEQTKFLTLPPTLVVSLGQTLLPTGYRFYVLDSPVPASRVLYETLHHPRYTASLANVTNRAVDWLGITNCFDLIQCLILHVADLLQGFAVASAKTNEKCVAAPLPNIPATYFNLLIDTHGTDLNEGLVDYVRVAPWADEVNWEKLDG